MYSEFEGLFSCLQAEGIHVGVETRERILRLGLLRRLQEEQTTLARGSLVSLTRALVLSPDVDRLAFERAIASWLRGGSGEEASNSDRRLPESKTALPQSVEHPSRSGPTLASRLLDVFVSADARIELFFRKTWRLAVEVGAALVKRGVKVLDVVGFTLVVGGGFAVWRAWPARVVGASSGHATPTRPLPLPPPELPQRVWNQTAVWLLLELAAATLVLAMLAYVVARFRPPAVRLRAPSPPPSLPPASPHSERELRQLVFRLGLVAQDDEPRLDLEGTARLSARMGLLTFAYKYARKTPRVWFVLLQPLEPWAFAIVSELQQRLESFGVDAKTHPAQRSSQIQDDDVALIIVDSSRFKSRAEADKAIQPWTSGVGWALVESRDPAHWGPEVAHVLDFEPVHLTTRGLVSALLVVGLRRNRVRAIRRPTPANGISSLYDAFPLAVVASLLEPLDFGALSELRKRFFSKLEPLAILRFLALDGVTQEPRGISVSPELRRDLRERWQRSLATKRSHRGSEWFDWRLNELQHEMKGAFREASSQSDPQLELEEKQALAVREHALLSIDCAALATAGITPQVSQADISVALKRLYGLYQLRRLRPTLERRLKRRLAGGDWGQVLARLTGESKLLAARLGLVSGGLGSLWPTSAEFKFLRPRLLTAGAIVLAFLAAAWNRLPDPRQPKCAAGRTLCGDLCYDLKVDPAHCGSCDKWTEPGMICREGQPVQACAYPSRICDDECVRVDTDPEHCGDCGISCNTGEECFDSKCRAACTPCADKCSYLNSDPANCGKCGVSCAAGKICLNGACTLGEGIDCGGHRLTAEALQSDPSNCGACGATCAKSDPDLSGRCRGGFCEYCASTYRNCNLAAADGCEVHLGTAENCGGCGDVCLGGAHQTATCDLTAKGSPCKVACEQGFADCSGDPGCETSVDSDPERCGGCNSVCPMCPFGNRECSAGVCGCACPKRGQTLCSSGCVDLQSDKLNCGACGTSCRAPTCTWPGTTPNADCTGGKCALRCTDGMTLCGSCCFDTKSDRMACGSCGNICGTPGANMTPGCTDGRCTASCDKGFNDCDGKVGCETEGSCSTSPVKLAPESPALRCAQDCSSKYDVCVRGCQVGEKKRDLFGIDAERLGGDDMSCEQLCAADKSQCLNRCGPSAG